MKRPSQSRAIYSLLHHLFLVFVLSLQIPITGSIFKETVKINPAEPILSTNYPSLDLSTPQISPQRSRVHSQNTHSLAECQSFSPIGSGSIFNRFLAAIRFQPSRHFIVARISDLRTTENKTTQIPCYIVMLDADRG